MLFQHQLRGDRESSHDTFQGITPTFTWCVKESHENHQTGWTTSSMRTELHEMGVVTTLL
jgi:hypothetical protein